MDFLYPQYFFDLATLTHRELFKTDEYVWTALGKIDKYLDSKKLGDIQVNVPRGTFLENPELISIEEGAVIESGAFIRGPCFISAGSQVRHGAYIRGNVLVGKGCVVGHATEVKNSILLDGAQAGHFAYIGDTILGQNVNLGAGTKCANLKLDHGEIAVTVNGKTVSSGRKKFGAIVGDRSQLGCNSVTNPGTLIGPNAKVYPCISVRGFIPAEKVVKTSERTLVGE